MSIKTTFKEYFWESDADNTSISGSKRKQIFWKCFTKEGLYLEKKSQRQHQEGGVAVIVDQFVTATDPKKMFKWMHR